jgi:hypothetical protein
VARGAPADDLFAAVAEEVGRIHAADDARLARGSRRSLTSGSLGRKP